MSSALLLGRNLANLDPAQDATDSLFAATRADDWTFSKRTYSHCTFANISFAATNVDDCVDVTDTLGGTLGSVCSTDASPTSFNYSHDVTGTPGTCVTVENNPPDGGAIVESNAIGFERCDEAADANSLPNVLVDGDEVDIRPRSRPAQSGRVGARARALGRACGSAGGRRGA